MTNLLYEKLKHLTLKDAIKFEENDRQFLALKSLWENISKKEGEKEEKIFFYLSIVLINSLVCYQLSGKGEDYWEEFSLYFADKFEKNLEIDKILQMMEDFLKQTKNNKRFVNFKVKRLWKIKIFLNDFRQKEKYFYENMLELDEKLAKTMNQKSDAKTIVFAVKMYSYSARNIFPLVFFPQNLMIPIDSRLTEIYKKYSKNDEKIADFYKNLCLQLKIPMLHLDAIIWTSFDELMK